MNSAKVGTPQWLIIAVIAFYSCNAFAQSGTWVWMNGSDTFNSPGNYGTKGVVSVNNCPQALYQAAQWTDRQGNLWLFGGVDSLFHAHSDLWKYNPGTNTWVWVNGPGIADQFA